nr:MAG TPA: hypothetical protein [Caudoviricetes sp.]
MRPQSIYDADNERIVRQSIANTAPFSLTE